MATRVQHEHGFYAHFLNIQNGERVFQSEVSSIDTAIFFAECSLAAPISTTPKSTSWPRNIFERVDWSWMLQNKKTLSMGWTPEHGFLHTRWDTYSELMMIYLLGIGSVSHALPSGHLVGLGPPHF